jgi:hypothetical protein
VEGYGLERGFGMLINESEDDYIGLEITTGQLCMI